MILAVRIRSKSRMWGPSRTPLRSEPRNSQAHPPLSTRSAEWTRLDDLTPAGFSPCPANPASLRRTPLFTLTVPTTPPFAACYRSLTLRCSSRLSTIGGETTVPPSRPQLVHLADCRMQAVPILPFPPPFLAGTAGWRGLLRPGGTALLCFPGMRDPPGFRSLPKRLAITCLASQRIFFSAASPQKKRCLAWGAGATCPRVPREKAGRKRRKTLCIKTAFPSSASSATTPN